MAWTNEQQQAIDAKGCALLVSAAAGSGKTTVLVEKLSKLLCDPESGVRADNIIIVTFTRDAAAQMRARLSVKLEERLEEALSGDEINAQLADHITDQISMLSAARISTIHSFCFRLIRENAGEAGVDPGFSPVEPKDEDLIVSKAFSDVLNRRFSEAPDEMSELMTMFLPKEKNSDKLIEILTVLRSRFLALPFPKEREREIVSFYENTPDKKDGLIYSEYMAQAKNSLTTAAEIAGRALDFLVSQKEYAGKQYEKLEKTLRTEYVNITDAVRMIGGDSRPVIEFGSIRINKFGIDGTDDDSGSETLKELRKKYRAMCSKYADTAEIGKTEKKAEYGFTDEQIKNDYAVHARICSLLFSILDEEAELERQMKLEKNVLGFSDSEQIACELLCRRNEDGTIEKKPLALELSERFSLIMVDEFQDTTKIQELIFKMLSAGGTPERPGTNFFAVGDLKQSIYRFRSAEPSLFKNGLTNSIRYEIGCKEPAHILLNRNFRSSQQIVDFVNTVFRALMSERIGGVDYGMDDMLIHGAEDKDGLAPVRVIDVMTGNEKRSTKSDTACEAAAVAAAVKELTDSGVSPSSICILARNTTRFPAFAQALRDRGIRCDHEKNGSILDSGEVRSILSFLRVIDNPTLDADMGAVLMSPLFMFTAAELARIRSIDLSASLRSDMQMYISADNEDASPLLVKKCSDFLDRLARLREFFAVNPIRDGIDKIYSETDAFAVYSVLDDSDHRIASLRSFAAYAEGYDNTTGGDLSAFLRTVSRTSELPSDTPDSTDTVSLRSIHRSKGLEYDHVFLVDNSHNFRFTNDPVRFNADLGISFPIIKRDSESGELYRYESMPGAVIAEKNRTSQTDEEMMLLYVALTRAKKGLYITRLHCDAIEKEEHLNSLLLNRDGKNDAAAVLSKSFSGWLSTALPLCSGIEYIEGGKQQPQMEAETVLPPADPVLEHRIRHNLTDNYDYSRSEMASKFTVSALVHEQSENRIGIASPVTTSVDMDTGISEKTHSSSLTAAERGTAIHAFLEKLDMKGLYNASDKLGFIHDERERIAQIIGTEQARCFTDRMALRFADSVLLERIMKGGAEIYRERQFFVRISDLDGSDGMFEGYEESDAFLQGVADLIFREGDHYVIVDHKTDSNVTEEELKNRYSLQLGYYKKCFSLILDLPVTECLIYSVALGKEIIIFSDRNTEKEHR